MKTIIDKVLFVIKRGTFMKALWDYSVRKNPLKLNCLRHKPDFLIIGAMKSGTTYLFNILNEHPDLKLPKVKELNYFDLYYRYGDSWYSYQFPFKFKKKSISGEATPYYLYHPLAAERSFRYNPNFKIIVLLRNPVSRAISHYNMIVNHRKMKWDPSIILYINEEIAIQEALEKKLIESKHAVSRIHRNYSFIRRGLYLYQIKEWEKYFPKENILVVKSENLYSKTEYTLSEICKFIGIPFDSKLCKKEVNKFQGKYDHKLDDDIIAAICDYYKPHNYELENHLKIKFGWD